MVGAAVHDDPDAGSPSAAGDRGSSATTSSSTAPVPTGDAVPAPTGATTAESTSTTGAGPALSALPSETRSGLGTTGNGSVATGGGRLAETGANSSSVPVLVLLSLAAASRALSQRARILPGGPVPDQGLNRFRG